MSEVEELVEQFARAMFDEWPLHAVSPAMAEQSGQPLGTPLTYDKVLEMGGNHDGLLRLARGAVKQHLARLSEENARMRGLRDALCWWESIAEDCEECARFAAEMLPGTRLCPNDVRIADHLDDVRKARAALTQGESSHG